jgi:predicted  nucleic acid-binding Zn-ribbon protein
MNFKQKLQENLTSTLNYVKKLENEIDDLECEKNDLEDDISELESEVRNLEDDLIEMEKSLPRTDNSVYDEFKEKFLKEISKKYSLEELEEIFQFEPGKGIQLKLKK